MPISRPRMPIKKSKQEIDLYIKYGPVFNKTLLYLKEIVEEGLYWDLEDKFICFCTDVFKDKEIKSISFPFQIQKNYSDKEFGHAICVSVNNVVAHGQPTILKLGDIVSVDCGICLSFNNGTSLNFDSAFTTIFGGKPDKDSWIYKPQRALKEIVKRQPKNTNDISTIIRAVAIQGNLKQVVSMTGHGIGHNLHEPPAIHNAPGNFGTVDLFNGIIFCAEPIYIKPKEETFDKFIVQTALGSNGWEVLTTSDEESTHFETMFCFVDGEIIDVIGISEWVF